MKSENLDQHRSTSIGSIKDYAIGYVLNGHAYYNRLDGYREKLLPGDFYQRIPGVSHILEMSRDYSECFIFIELSLFENLQKCSVLNTRIFTGHTPLSKDIISHFDLIADELCEIEESRQSKILVKILTLIQDLYSLRKINWISSDNRKMIKDCCDMLTKDFKERTPIAEIASRYNISYGQFRKVFHEITGLTPVAYRASRRLSKARTLLLSTDETVLKISDALGYANPFVFSREFKLAVGESPNIFRKSPQAPESIIRENEE